MNFLVQCRQEEAMNWFFLLQGLWWLPPALVAVWLGMAQVFGQLGIVLDVLFALSVDAGMIAWVYKLSQQDQ